MAAWAPVFESIRRTLPEELLRRFYGDDWRAAQRKAVIQACTNPDHETAVAENEAGVAGFVVITFNEPDRIGEIYMIATSPESQRAGVATALTRHALDRMHTRGIEVAMVETGGDPGHALARRLYERSGFTLWPAARYFKPL